MITNTVSIDHYTLDLSSDKVWRDLYPSLRSLAQRLVSSFGVQTWQGQKRDIAEDVVQETARRLIEYSQKAGRGEVAPICSIKSLMTAIAYNYCKDLRRHDRRLLRITSSDYSPETVLAANEQAPLPEVATENVYQEWLFTLAAHEIADFPEKQRKALLIDLANRMHFDTHPSALQAAFLKVGIRLQDYQQPLPANHTERSRHASLVSYAYKRLTLILGEEMDSIAA
jgi:DNA-directed RNA polymerase specialized sigma24 family protein